MSPNIITDRRSVKMPTDVMSEAFDAHANVTVSFSGAEDVVLIDMATNLTDEVNVFTLDTGRLHPETYRYIEAVRDFYGIDINVVSPDGAALAEFVRENGLFSFYRDGHHGCCSVRKIEPLARHLAGHDAWITGQRRDQSPTRADVPQSQVDTAFSTKERTVTKYNPLAEWTSAEVWTYIRENEIPYNELHDRGFYSIGCEPCTRPVGPNQHERQGRWWWEETTKRECGLHSINLASDDMASGDMERDDLQSTNLQVTS